MLGGLVWASLCVWVPDVINNKAEEFRKYRLPKRISEGRHGNVDQRILTTDLQKK